MNPVLKRRIFVGIISILLLTAGFDTWYQWNHLIVTVEYEGPPNAPAADVEISVRGDMERIESLGVGERKTITLEPAGWSAVTVRLWVGGAPKEERTFGCAVNRTGGYRADITVRGGSSGAHFWLWPLEQSVNCF